MRLTSSTPLSKISRLLIFLLALGNKSLAQENVFVFGQQGALITNSILKHADSVIKNSVQYKMVMEAIAKSGDGCCLMTEIAIDSTNTLPYFADTISLEISTFPEGIPCGATPACTLYWDIKTNAVVIIKFRKDEKEMKYPKTIWKYILNLNSDY